MNTSNMKEALFSVPPGRQIEYICYVNYANLFNIPLFWMFKNLKIYGKKNVVMDGRTDIRSCEYRAKILDLDFSTCIEEKIMIIIQNVAVIIFIILLTLPGLRPPPSPSQTSDSRELLSSFAETELV